MMNIFLFWFIFVGEILLGFALLVSHLSPSRRIWPPPGKKTWQFYYIWVLTYTSLFGLIALGLFDWNSFIFQNIFWFSFGGILLIVGLIVLIWGVQTLSLYVSHGQKGELITDGLYKFSRNPQYLGINIAILGYIFLTNSVLTLITNIIGIFLFFLTPFVEEPWLRKEFGSKYNEYCTKVRRFL